MTDSSATPLPSPKERRRLREAKSLSQTEVAARVGVTRETVRSWETGRTTPRGRKLEAYATLLSGPELDGALPAEASVSEVAAVAAEVSVRHEDPVLALVGVGGGPSSALPEEAPAPAPVPDDVLEPLTPAQAFDAL